MLTAEYDYEMDIEVQREEAFENGKESGLQAGKEQFAKLTRCLLNDNRIDDLRRVTEDSTLQIKLMKEYKII